RKTEIRKEREGHSATSRYNFVYRADSGWVYAAQSLDVSARAMNDLLRQREGTGGGNTTNIIAATSGQYHSISPRWPLDHGALRYLIGAGQEAAFSFDK